MSFSLFYKLLALIFLIMFGLSQGNAEDTLTLSGDKIPLEDTQTNESAKQEISKTTPQRDVATNSKIQTPDTGVKPDTKIASLPVKARRKSYKDNEELKKCFTLYSKKDTKDLKFNRLIINLPACRMYACYDSVIVNSYSVCVGDSWSPIGNYKILKKIKNPSFFPPNREWAKDMKYETAGPNNPLGTRVMQFAFLEDGTGVYIHGCPQDKRWSVGHARSHGCVRMYKEDIEKIYEEIPIGTPVILIYKPFVYIADKNQLKTYKDVYKKMKKKKILKVKKITDDMTKDQLNLILMVLPY